MSEAQPGVGSARPWWFIAPALTTFAGAIAYGFLPEDDAPRAVAFVVLQLFLVLPVLVVLTFRREQRLPLWWVLLTALSVRLACLPSDLIFENDVFRYLWDARVAASGTNPYRYAPAAPELAGLVDDWIYPQIPYRQVPTIYPPVAQLVFLVARGVGGESVFALQGVMIALDLVTVFVLARLGQRLGAHRAAAAYALHPLVLKEFSQAAHVDAAAVLLVTTAAWLITERRTRAAAAALAGATLVKVFPLFMLPAVIRRLGARGLAVYGAIVAGVLGAVAVSGAAPLAGLKVFSQYWIFNPSLYDLAVRLLSLGLAPEVAYAWGRPLCGAVLLVPLAIIFLKVDPADDRSVLKGMLACALALLMCSPAANPWYIAWLTPLALLLDHRPALVFTFLASLAYCFYVRGEDVAWTRGLEYAPVYGLVAFELWRSRALTGQKNRPQNPEGNVSSPSKPSRSG